jgi:hypothetical protein
VADALRRFAGKAAKGTAFPALLIALVVGFIAVQDQIDRRDPKLARTPLRPDLRVEFE